MNFSRVLFTSFLLVSLIGCGQKSTIKNAVEAKGFEQTDGLVKELSLAIVPEGFEATIPNLGIATPVVNGLAKLLLKVGIVKGTRKFSINQPVPELPEEFIKSVVLNRVFFVIEEENFNFINKLAVMVSPKRIQNEHNILTSSPADEKELNSTEKRNFFELFDPTNIYTQQMEQNREKEVVVIKYDKLQRDSYTHTENLENTYIIETGNAPGMLDYFLYDLGYKRKKYFKKFEILGSSLLVELNPGLKKTYVGNIKKMFEEDLERISTQAEFAFRKKNICTPQTCIDIQTRDELNILDLITSENSLQLDALVDVTKAPGAFKVKGYIQVQVKLRSPIN